MRLRKTGLEFKGKGELPTSSLPHLELARRKSWVCGADTGQTMGVTPWLTPQEGAPKVLGLSLRGQRQLTCTRSASYMETENKQLGAGTCSRQGQKQTAQSTWRTDSAPSHHQLLISHSSPCRGGIRKDTRETGEASSPYFLRGRSVLGRV